MEESKPDSGLDRELMQDLSDKPWQHLVDVAKKMEMGSAQRNFVADLINEKLAKDLLDLQKTGELKKFLELQKSRKDSPDISRKNKANVEDLFKIQLNDMADPDKSLDEKLLCYLKIVEAYPEQASKLKEIFKAIVLSAMEVVTPTTALFHAQDVLAINRCVNVLREPELSAKYVQLKKEWTSGTSESMAKTELKFITQENLTFVEKAMKMDAVIACYYLLHNKIPKALKEEYDSLSEECGNNVVRELQEIDEAKYSKADIEGWQREVLGKRNPASSVFSALAKESTQFSEYVAKSILKNVDTNAAILAIRRWTEIAVMLYKAGDFSGAQAVFGGISNPALVRITDAMRTDKIVKLDIELKSVKNTVAGSDKEQQAKDKKIIALEEKIKGLKDPHTTMRDLLVLLYSNADGLKYLRGAEKFANDQALTVIPFVGFKTADITMTTEAVPKPKDGEPDKLPMLLEPTFNSMKKMQHVLGERTSRRSLDDTFGRRLSRSLTVEEGDRHKKMLDPVNESQKVLVIPAPAFAEALAKGLEASQIQIKEWQQPHPEPKGSTYAEAYNFHIKKNGGISFDFENSPEKALYLERENILKTNGKESPEYKSFLDRNAEFKEYLISTRVKALEKQYFEEYKKSHKGARLEAFREGESEALQQYQIERNRYLAHVERHNDFSLENALKKSQASVSARTSTATSDTESPALTKKPSQPAVWRVNKSDSLSKSSGGLVLKGSRTPPASPTLSKSTWRSAKLANAVPDALPKARIPLAGNRAKLPADIKEESQKEDAREERVRNLSLSGPPKKSLPTLSSDSAAEVLSRVSKAEQRLSQELKQEESPQPPKKPLPPEPPGDDEDEQKKPTKSTESRGNKFH